MTSITSSHPSIARRNLLQPINSDPTWINARFGRALDIVESLPRSGPIQTNYDDKLLLYSLYKQATQGDINSTRPGILDILGRAKWEAWNKKRGMSSDEAKRLYVEALLKILRGYADRTIAVELIRELQNFSLVPVPERRPSRGSHILDEEEYETDSQSESETSSEGSSVILPRSSQLSQPPGGPSSQREYQEQYRRQHSNQYKRRGQKEPKESIGQERVQAQLFPSSVDGSLYADRPVAPSLPGYGPPRTRADSLRNDSTEPPTTSTEPQASTIKSASRPPSVLGSFTRTKRPSSVRSQVVYPGPTVFPGEPESSRPFAQVPYITGQQFVGQVGVQSPAAAPHIPYSAVQSFNSAPLDAALDRIQTSLTALHERLSTLESSSQIQTTLSREDSALRLMGDLFMRMFDLLRGNQTRSRQPSVLSIMFRLILVWMSHARRIMSDFGVLFVLIAVIGRIRTGEWGQAIHVLWDLLRPLRFILPRPQQRRIQN